jgi:hypothetical protein
MPDRVTDGSFACTDGYRCPPVITRNGLTGPANWDTNRDTGVMSQGKTSTYAPKKFPR